MKPSQRCSLYEKKQIAINSMNQLMRMNVQSSKILFEPDQLLTQIPSRLAIDRYNYKASETKEKLELNSQVVYGVLGLLKISAKPALFYIDEAEVVGVIDDWPIYQALSVSALFLDVKEANEHKENEKKLVDKCCQFFQTSFFFSYGFDLANTRKNSRFWWNQNMVKSFPESWQTKFIQGYVGYYQTSLKSMKWIQYFLISRRSIIKSGTMQNDTGLDSEGNAANFVETEQILILDKLRASQILLRGSVPLYWTQNILTGQMELTKELDTQRQGFQRHFSQILKQFKKVHFFHLGDNSLLVKTIDRVFNDTKIDGLTYVKIDMDEVVQNSDFQTLNQQVEFDADYSFQSYQQQHVTRVSCIDSLDRSNIFLCKLALKSIQDIFLQWGIDLIVEFGSSRLHAEIDQPSVHHLHPFLIYFKQKWAENGEHIQLVYKIGKQTDSLNQFYSNMMDVKMNSEIINRISGNQLNISQFMENISNLERNMKRRESEFIRQQDISVYIVTWNINAHNPCSDTSIYNKLFDFKNQQPPTFIAVGFQELVKLNINNVVVNNNKEHVDRWSKIISNVIANYGSYTLIGHQAMVGTFVMIFVQKSELPNVSNCTSEIVKYGFGQKLGNKGGVIMKLRFYDSSIGFINVHLPAGQKHNEDRLTAFDYIHNKADIGSLDWVITFGDMNFRVNLPYQRVVESLQQYNHSQIKEHRDAILKQLKENDQLTIEKHKSQHLKKFDEADITFAPTYKFEIGSDIHDTVKKRVPSFTDRILMRKIQNISIQYPVFYKSIQGPFQVSDHRPVCCYVQTQVCSVDEEKKDVLFRQLVQTRGDLNLGKRYFQHIEVVKNFDLCIRNRPRKSYFKTRVTLDTSIGDNLQSMVHPFPDLC